MIQIAYFTHSGNTRVVADKIASRTGGELFRIETVSPYPEGYQQVVEVARKELREGRRPRLRSTHLVGGCETLFLGFPNWWATMPMPVFSFLEGSNFDGVAIAPFCTHEGSGMGRSVQDIRRVCPGATVSEGLAIRGSQVGRSDALLDRWIESIGIPISRSLR
jgi:flavodoxin